MGPGDGISASGSDGFWADPAVDFPIYFLVISAACVACVWWSARRAAARGMDRALALDVGLALMVFGFLGGRLMHALYERPDLYVRDPLQLLRFWEGGFVFFGGAFAAIAAGAWVVQRQGGRFAEWADFFAPLGALSYALGRAACWLTGCCYGRWCSLPSGERVRFPTQALAIATEAATLGALLWLEQRRSRPFRQVSPQGGRLDALATSGEAALRRPGAEFALWVFLHSIGRIAMEAFRADDRGPTVAGLGVSFWIAAALAIGSVAFLRSPQSETKSS